MLAYAALALLGFAVGCLGTAIGAGGGFLLVPVLVLLYPDAAPETIASISLAVVAANALSGTIAYLRQRRVDIRAGLWFSAAAIPGSVLGAIAVGYLPRASFELILGAVLLGAGVFLLSGRRKLPTEAPHHDSGPLGPQVPHHRGAGLFVSFVVGGLSSLLGIGGGIIHVPAMVHLLGFPVHVATATSHFVLATTATAGTATHIVTGAFHVGWRRAIALSVGAVIGAQVGALLARRTAPSLLLRGLAVALLAVGARIAYQGLRAQGWL
ncbi:MAG: sulfite exporter TauE/SafE family protein [Phycisphaerales bacterium]